MESIIVFGGSFDPIHNGHLRIARAASLALNADVVFVPSKAPQWKKPEATPKQRLDMLKLALRNEGCPSFSIDTFEINGTAEVNYTVDLLRHIAAKHRGKKIYLLIGGDQVNSFRKWHDPEGIVALATPLFVTRTGYVVDEDIVREFRMTRLDYDGGGEVSSTRVRSLQDVDIPLPVRDYIESNNLYYMAKLSGLLSPKRMRHSLSVANLAYALAQKNRLLGYRRAYIAGLLHDIGKEMDKETLKKIMDTKYPECASFPEWSFHQFAGAFIAETVFGIKDPDILDAICCHATGKAHMGPLAKIIYSSDKIEPTRGWNSSSYIRACYKHYYVGFLNVLAANRDFLKEKGYKVDNPWTKECFALYLGEPYDEEE